MQNTNNAGGDSASLQDQRPSRVLHVLGSLDMGGAESRIMDLYRHIDRQQLQFDFLVHTKAAGENGADDSDSLMAAREPQYFDEEIRALGGRIYAFPRFNGKNLTQYRRAASRFFLEHAAPEWIAVEGHMTSMASVYLPIAKKWTGAATIAHVRSAGTESGIRGLATKLFRSSLPKRADILLSCSRDAGYAVYGCAVMEAGRVTVVPNAIDAGKYRYQEEVRSRVRAELLPGSDDSAHGGIPEGGQSHARDEKALQPGMSRQSKHQVVLGHVGRFDEMKNQIFLVELLAGLIKTEAETTYYLLMIGEGKLASSVADRAEELGIADRVTFAGKCSPARTAELYQAMDLFVFPSLYEGLPGTVVEAQAAGLPCLIADTITDEVCLTSLVKRLPLQEPGRWEEAVQGEVQELRKQRSDSALTKIEEAGYDITTQAARMQEWYLKQSRKHLLLISPMLHQGGFEKVCVQTARYLQPYYDVTILIFTDRDRFYDTDGIRVVNIDIPSESGKIQKIWNVLRRVRRVRRAKKELGIDVTYSLGATANIVNSLTRTGDRIICGIHGGIDLDNAWQMKLFLGRADQVLCCSRGMLELLRKRYGEHEENTCYVVNPIDNEEIRRLAGPDNSKVTAGEEIVLITVGREDPQKGYWHLLKAFSLVVKKHPGALLSIVGAGSFDGYRKLAEDLGIADHVRFEGLQKNPYPYFAAGDLYVLSSNHEGFPVAMAEAMALGLPVVAADCQTGPREILLSEEEYALLREANSDYETGKSGVIYGEYGVLVPGMSAEENFDAQVITDEDRLFAEVLTKLLEDEELRKAYCRKSPVRAEEYSPQSYVKALRAVL